jgi:glutathione S-transferase
MQALGTEVPPEMSGMAGFGDFQRTLDTLLRAVPETGYLTGAKFTAADVYMGAQIGWGVQFGSIPKTPAVEAYLGRIQSRRGYIRAKELDDAAGPEFAPGA